MAFVGISNELRSQVEMKIRNMQDAELQTLGKNPMDTHNFTGNESWFLDKVWEGKHHLAADIPEHWFGKHESIGLRIKLNWDGIRKTLSNSGDIPHLYAKLPSKTQLPPRYQDRYPDVYIGFAPGETLPPELQVAYEFQLKVKEVRTRWNTVQAKVGEFLRSCKSLNEALKLWPEVKVYIPKEYLDRVEKKTGRSTPTSNALDVLKTIDVQEMQAAAVIARMSGAQV